MIHHLIKTVHISQFCLKIFQQSCMFDVWDFNNACSHVWTYLPRILYDKFYGSWCYIGSLWFQLWSFHVCFHDVTFAAAMGDGFIARDITFVNDAGPSKHQAVALRVGADKSVIYRCAIIGYQDTLYTHSKRQFYRETDIYGTVDFIFGNSAVVFQSCNIYPRKPPSTGLKNFVTAQGRSSPNQNTGISIHNCKIAAASDLAPVKSSYETYLGRPWHQYSRTVIMESVMDDSISRAGWSPWSGGFGLNTLFYGEYLNSGPGASTSARVRWGGYHASLTSSQAQAFTVGGFLSGNLWLPSTGVSFDSGLIG